MPEQVRRLNQRGLEVFRSYLGRLRESSTEDPPRELLHDPERAYSSEVESDAAIERRGFRNRLEAATYLNACLAGGLALEEDVGLWAWLSLFYFDVVCPVQVRGDGRRKPGRDYRHILEPGYRYGHRHLLAGPCAVHRLHGEKAKLLLCTKVHVENHFHHQLASRQALISNPGIVEAADRLYWSARARKPKRGAQKHDRPGGLLRFVAVLHQLDVNYDLYSMSGEAILRLLPHEFRGWMPVLRRMRRRHRVRAVGEDALEEGR